MLTQRTNVLLSSNEYSTLRRLAISNNQTLGELIRHAIRLVYKIDSTSDNSLSTTLARIRNLTQKVNTKNLNYRDLATSDRKYD